jgi:TolB protein
MSFDRTRPSRLIKDKSSTFSLLLTLVVVIITGCALLAASGILFTRGNATNWNFMALSPQTATPPLVFPTPVSTHTFPPVSSALAPSGKIVFACQVYYQEQHDQICLVNADGTGYRQITDDSTAEYFYPSFSPAGDSVVFVSNHTGSFEIYEMDLQGVMHQLTIGLGDLFAPEISPDGSLIAFTCNNSKQLSAVWVMNRDGSDPHRVFGPTPAEGWDPTWSPDGKQILFASRSNGNAQLFIVNLDGTGLRQVTHMDDLRGRSDWSAGDEIVTYAGVPWHRELYTMNIDGSKVMKVTPEGGNSQGPSFSPDGKWVAFTAYFDNFHNPDGCEIYVMNLDTSVISRLTFNNYCDYQPRWGP